MTTAVIEITSYTLQIIFFHVFHRCHAKLHSADYFHICHKHTTIMISVLRNAAACQAVNSCMSA